jgi:heterotetrameric sarcosine oxidase delta subunit
MGFKIDCPNCGSRSYHEYWFGGELRSYNCDDDPDADYASTWLRDNVAGSQSERWFHHAGCRRWLTIERDTRRNNVMSSRGSA